MPNKFPEENIHLDTIIEKLNDYLEELDKRLSFMRMNLKNLKSTYMKIEEIWMLWRYFQMKNLYLKL